MNADQAKAAADMIAQQLQHEWRVTYKVLTAVPEGSKDYKPEPNSRGAFDLARHLAGADVWFIDGIVKGRFDDPQDSEPALNTVAELGEWYKHHFPAVLERALAMDGPRLAETLEFFGQKMQRVNYLLFALVHMVHHRGQLAAYLRPMGGKVPSIYGGSYDQPWRGSEAETATT